MAAVTSLLSSAFVCPLEVLFLETGHFLNVATQIESRFLSIANDGSCDWTPTADALAAVFMMLLAYDLCRSLLAALLKPAYARNKIRAWGDSLATWPEKRGLFICSADRPGRRKGVRFAESGRCEVKVQQMPFSHRSGGPLPSQRAPTLIAGAENTRGLTFIRANTSQQARGPQHAQSMP